MDVVSVIVSEHHFTIFLDRISWMTWNAFQVLANCLFFEVSVRNSILN